VEQASEAIVAVHMTPVRRGKTKAHSRLPVRFLRIGADGSGGTGSREVPAQDPNRLFGRFRLQTLRDGPDNVSRRLNGLAGSSLLRALRMRVSAGMTNSDLQAPAFRKGCPGLFRAWAHLTYAYDLDHLAIEADVVMTISAVGQQLVLPSFEQFAKVGDRVRRILGDPTPLRTEESLVSRRHSVAASKGVFGWLTRRSTVTQTTALPHPVDGGKTWRFSLATSGLTRSRSTPP
jgi:hypothetical protein